MKNFILFFAAFLIFAPRLVATEMSPAWKAWVEKYASSNPLRALNKNYSPALKITDDEVKSVLNGKSVVKFSTPLKESGKEVKNFDLLQLSHSLVFGSADWYAFEYFDGMETEKAWKHADRMKEMLKNLETVVLNRPADELVIVDMGGEHALDLYFDFFLKGPDNPLHKVRQDILYFLSPIDEATLKYHPSLARFRDIRAGEKEANRSVDYNSYIHNVFFLSRLYYYNNLNREIITFEKLKAEPPAKLGVLVFMDHHGLNATAAFDELPSASEIKRSGFKTVKIYTENFLFNKTYPVTDYEKLCLITPEDLKKFKEENKAVIKYVANNQVIQFPAQYSLFHRLENYMDSGVKVVFTGIEHFERLGNAEE